ncbi:hypothetical protein GWK47_029821 [Chionoecetes opilio]|uniref:Uncharacterized protein n=1 Tax=Chionoecetes opilio TaxID=41210 RepID=A0A8J4YK46_CHIOP|nr:hypothetical protein GWK47_029821 [Chionoecetes opilio]
MRKKMEQDILKMRNILKRGLNSEVQAYARQDLTKGGACVEAGKKLVRVGDEELPNSQGDAPTEEVGVEIKAAPSEGCSEEVPLLPGDAPAEAVAAKRVLTAPPSSGGDEKAVLRACWRAPPAALANGVKGAPAASSALRLPALPSSGGKGRAGDLTLRQGLITHPWLKGGLLPRLKTRRWGECGKGRAGGLTLRQVRTKHPRLKAGRPPRLKKGHKCGERRKSRSQQGRPRRARMKKMAPYLPLLRRQEDGERRGWPPPPKLWQVAVTACYDGGRHRRAFYQAVPAAARCC